MSNVTEQRDKLHDAMKRLQRTAIYQTNPGRYPKEYCCGQCGRKGANQKGRVAHRDQCPFSVLVGL